MMEIYALLFVYGCIAVFATWNAYQCIFVLLKIKAEQRRLVDAQIADQQWNLEDMRKINAHFRPALAINRLPPLTK